MTNTPPCDDFDHSEVYEADDLVGPQVIESPIDQACRVSERQPV
jgi:hypothetical protein